MNLTDNELAIMRALWSAPRPLTRKEIVATSAALRCKRRTVYVLLNGLVAKGMIYVAGYMYNGEHSSRVFVPALSQVEYTAKLSHRCCPLKNTMICSIFLALHAPIDLRGPAALGKDMVCIVCF